MFLFLELIEMNFSQIFLIFLLGLTLVSTKTIKPNSKDVKDLTFEQVLEAIRENPNMTEREKFDLELNLTRAFYSEQAKKKEHQRKKQQALLGKKKEEAIYRKQQSKKTPTGNTMLL